jgi:putative IMPACT (imprinted ancient) family translation regulator
MCRSLNTIASRARHEATIKKSKFVAWAMPVDATNALERIRELSDLKATHNVYAYRLADGVTRSNGDGEPGGTAGPPVLAAIERADLHNVAVLVTRYYGGVKLGTGGLARAYGGTAAESLSSAPRTALTPAVLLCARFAQDDTSAVFGVLSRFGHGFGPTVESSGAAQLVRFSAPKAEVPAIERALSAATKGRVRVRLAEDGGR